MSTRVKIDAATYREKINELVARIGDGGRVLRVEGRKLLEYIQSATPPRNYQQGKIRVQADLRKVFFPLDTQDARSTKRSLKKSDGTMVELYFTKNGQCFSAKRDDVKLQASAAEMAQIHQSARNARGRVSGRGNRITKDPRNAKNNVVNRTVVKGLAFRRYEREVLKHVGKMRGGWGPGMMALGAKVPSWVLKNSTAENGRVVNGLANKNAFIEVSNTTPGVATEMGDALRRGIAARVRAIGKNLLRMAKHGKGATGDYGYAKA